MKRRIIQSDEQKCNGCGACAAACHEGAIAMVEGKARLMRDDYCDGLGDCLPACPTGAITFVEREAAPYDEAAVLAAKQRKAQGTGCPGSAARTLHGGCPGSAARALSGGNEPAAAPTMAPSRLRQWPVQIKLVPMEAPFFDGAKLLIAADCTAYAYAAFHERFIRGHITLVGCPIVREPDGLAKSSRNTYLSKEERRAALVLSQAVALGEDLVASGETDARSIVTAMTDHIAAEPLARVDYVSAVDGETMEPVDQIREGVLVALAVYIGKTRLIDNFLVVGR